jgi:hypothetical protein
MLVFKLKIAIFVKKMNNFGQFLIEKIFGVKHRWGDQGENFLFIQI